ncbi:MAG: hypothetical protein ABG776_07060 [Cyanobacteria bacterium J06555_13]
MQSALQMTAKVLPGDRLEVQLPPGSEGKEVTVFIVLPTNPTHSKPQYADLAEMAADPDIQGEIAAINTEFLAAEMDGLK